MNKYEIAWAYGEEMSDSDRLFQLGLNQINMVLDSMDLHPCGKPFVRSNAEQYEQDIIRILRRVDELTQV